MSEGDFYDAKTTVCGADKYVPKDGGPTQYKFKIECVVQTKDGPQELVYRGDLDAEWFEKTEKAAIAAGVDVRSDDPREWTMRPGKAVRVALKDGKNGLFISWIGENKAAAPREITGDDFAAMRAQIAAARGRTAPARPSTPQRPAQQRQYRQSQPQGFASEQADDDIPF
jgi:hypothetical protein